MKLLTWMGAVGFLVLVSVIAEDFGFPQLGYVLFGLVIVGAILVCKR